MTSWNERVLSLLTEECQQSASVFGAEAAPGMVVKVRSVGHIFIVMLCNPSGVW
jgi:hypothetical protein